MTFPTPMLTSPVVQRLGWTLVHSLWQGAAIAVVLGVVLRVLRRGTPPSRYAAGCAAMLALAALPILTFFVLSGSTDDRPNASASWPTQVGRDIAAPTSVAPRQEMGASAAMARVNVRDVPPDEVPRPPSADAAVPWHRPTLIERIGALASFARSALSTFLPFLVWLWAAGVTALSLWNLGAFAAVRRLRIGAAAHPVDRATDALARRLMDRLGLRTVKVLQSAIIDSPMVIGAIKPAVLLPASMICGLPPAQLEALLAHELAHVLRHDYLVNLLQSVLETIFFYHPAAWWISQRIRIEREECCDDLAVRVTRDRASYVRALAAVAGVHAPALAPAASGGLLLPRLRRLLGMPDADAGRSPRWLAAALLIVLGGAIAATLGVRQIARAGTESADKKQFDAGDVIQVHGKVLDPSGHIVAGARVMAITSPWLRDTPLAETQSAADGTFSVSFRKSQFTGEWQNFWDGTGVAATAPGLAPAWDLWNATDASGDVVLRLPPDDIRIEGRVLDLDGRPVKGAEVTVKNVRPRVEDMKSMDITEWDLSNLGKRRPPPLGGFGFPVSKVTTDDDGQFRIPGIGRGRTASLWIYKPGIAVTLPNVATLPIETTSRTLQNYIATTATQYGARFEIAAEPERLITGVVRDADTGKPLPGVLIKPGSDIRAQATTDAQGRYTLLGLPKKKGLEVTAIPNDQQPYFMRIMDVPQTPGLGPVTVDFELHRGVWITGKVIDHATGRGVPDTRIYYLPWRSNPYVKNLPEWQRNLRIQGPEDRYHSGPDGTYRVVAAPGKALLRAWPAAGGGYRKGVAADKITCPRIRGFSAYDVYIPGASPDDAYALEEVDIPPGQENTNVDLHLEPGITIHLKTVDPQGKPLAGVVVVGTRPSMPYQAENDSEFDAVAFREDERRSVYFWYVPGKLAAAITLCPRDLPGRELTVKLEPFATIKGQLLRSDGQPMASARIEAVDSLGATGTDADGRFTLTLPAGIDYHLHGIKGRDEFNTDTDKIPLKPGEVKDVGIVHVKPYE
jgi:beta-lactamase regulating signal transducer with metallopeptidase domain